MSPDTPGEGGPSTGPPDRQTLRLLENHLAADPLIGTTAFDPNPMEPRLLTATIAEAQYPAGISNPRIDVRWFETNDFTVHYLEPHGDGTTWECRWDRHPNHHNTRTHFHTPPDASEITDLDLPSVHPLEVYSIVLTSIEKRIEELWNRS